jgi:hypothetical protein
MFRNDQATVLLMMLLQRLLRRLRGHRDLAGGALSCGLASGGAGTQSLNIARQKGGRDCRARSSVEWLTTRLDSIPLGCGVSVAALDFGGPMPVSRPAPPGSA